jgi:hypothetical protein
LLAGSLGVVLDEGGADERGDDTAALPAGMSEHIAHEVHATSFGAVG